MLYRTDHIWMVSLLNECGYVGVGWISLQMLCHTDHIWMVSLLSECGYVGLGGVSAQMLYHTDHIWMVSLGLLKCKEKCCQLSERNISGGQFKCKDTSSVSLALIFWWWKEACNNMEPAREQKDGSIKTRNTCRRSLRKWHIQPIIHGRSSKWLTVP